MWNIWAAGVIKKNIFFIVLTGYIKYDTILLSGKITKKKGNKMNATKEKTTGSFEIGKMELILSSTYREFEELFGVMILDKSEKEIFLKTVEREIIECFKGNGNICVQYTDEDCLYIFTAKDQDFKEYVFIKDTLTDNVFSYKFSVDKDNKVLH